MQYKGYIDSISANHVRGWAVAIADEACCNVSISALFDNEEVKTITATRYRADLKAAGFGSGQFGFDVEVSHQSNLDFTAATFLFPDKTPIPLTASAKKKISEIQESPVNINISRNIPNLDEILSLNHTSRLAHLVWYQSPTSPDLKCSLKKICIYVTYSSSPIITDAQKCQVDSFQKAGYFVVCVVAADRAPEDGSSLFLGDLTIVKKNIGYDFGSWWVGYRTMLNLLGNQIYEVEHFALCNDSYLGFVSSDEICELEERPEWLVGQTNSPQRGDHIQSYFAIAQNDYLKTGQFHNFISTYSFPKDKADVIKYGELGLSRGGEISTYAKHDYYHLTYLWISQVGEMIQEEYNARVRFGLYANLEKIESNFEDFSMKLRLGDTLNPTHAFWRQIVQSGSGILKTELLIKNPMNVPNWYAAVEYCIDHPALIPSIHNIKKHLSETRDQNTAILHGLLEMKTTKRSALNASSD
jgi:hypothetical protein